MGYGDDPEAIATEADVFIDALQQLPHDNNTLVWGKSDELMLLVHQVRTCCMLHSERLQPAFLVRCSMSRAQAGVGLMWAALQALPYCV